MTSAIVQRILDRFLRKYLKNVTTEHATVWGGQLVFKNVELRLDVLQEEVGLPLLFQRGFVQELKVFLPLTNLLREHIRVTLNNVEVIASTPASLDVHGGTSISKDNVPPSPGLHPTSSTAAGNDEKGMGGGEGEKDVRDKGLLEEWMLAILNRIAINVKVKVHAALLLIYYCFTAVLLLLDCR